MCVRAKLFDVPTVLLLLLLLLLLSSFPWKK
jgi:hypothetical protein